MFRTCWMLILLKKVYFALRAYSPKVSGVHAPSRGVRSRGLEDEQDLQCDWPPLGVSH